MEDTLRRLALVVTLLCSAAPAQRLQSGDLFRIFPWYQERAANGTAVGSSYDLHITRVSVARDSTVYGFALRGSDSPAPTAGVALEAGSFTILQGRPSSVTASSVAFDTCPWLSTIAISIGETSLNLRCFFPILASGQAYVAGDGFTVALSDSIELRCTVSPTAYLIGSFHDRFGRLAVPDNELRIALDSANPLRIRRLMVREDRRRLASAYLRLERAVVPSAAERFGIELSGFVTGALRQQRLARPFEAPRRVTADRTLYVFDGRGRRLQARSATIPATAVIAWDGWGARHSVYLRR